MDEVLFDGVAELEKFVSDGMETAYVAIIVVGIRS